jgi:hypothetical protein
LCPLVLSCTQSTPQCPEDPSVFPRASPSSQTHHLCFCLCASPFCLCVCLCARSVVCALVRRRQRCRFVPLPRPSWDAKMSNKAFSVIRAHSASIRTLSASIGTFSSIIGTLAAIIGTLAAVIGTLSAIIGILSAVIGTLAAIIGTLTAIFSHLNLSHRTASLPAQSAVRVCAWLRVLSRSRGSSPRWSSCRWAGPLIRPPLCPPARLRR